LFITSIRDRGVAEYSDFGSNHKNINWRSDCGSEGGNKDVCPGRQTPSRRHCLERSASVHCYGNSRTFPRV